MSENKQFTYKDYEDGLKVPYSSEGTFSIANWPEPMGYWILDPGPICTKFAQYKKPHRIHIWFTEKLLGWKWEDAK